MSSTEPADFLRERNKDLLKQLKQQREKLEQVSGCSRKRDREDEAEERRQPGGTGPGTGGGRGPARAAPTRPTLTRPTVTKPTVTRLSVTRPTVTKPTSTRPTLTKPTLPRPILTRPTSTKPTVTRLSLTRPTVTRPTSTRPTSTRPTLTRPTLTRPTVTKPSITKPSITKPTLPRPILTRPTSTRPTSTRPTVTKPSITKPTLPRPILTRPTSTRPTLTRPTSTRTTITRPTPTRPNPTRPSLRFAECADSSDILHDGERHLQIQDRLQDTTSHMTKACSVKNHEEDIEELSPVPFDECVETPVSDRHHLQPLLGYDWIAGVLDAEETFVERSDEFFNDLRNFRSLHKDECVHSPQAELSVENHSGLTLLTDKDDTEANTDTHQCTFSYRINSRLFPVPLHPQECCPVCKKPKSSHPHTTAEPALIRVSIPRSTLLPAYKYKAHRRCSFDPSDSLGLPSHCLSGWSHSGQSTLPPPSNLDLRSSLNTKNNELENLSVPVNQISDQISNMSKLARHNFQHFSPRNKIGSTSYPGC